jgi:hypothetical protein
MPNKKRQKKQTTRKKSAKKTTPKRNSRKRAASKRSSLARNKKFSAKRKRVTSTGLVVETAPVLSGEPPHLDGQAGDLQGLSKRPTANSKSVEELLNEGSGVEAEAIRGAENVPDADQGEVEHEVPEDDAPEYLDKDR